MLGIIFDVDGVIADTEPINAEASVKMMEDEFGLTGVKPEDFKEGIGKGAEAYVQAAARRHGRELSHRELERAVRKRQEYFLDIVRRGRLRPLPGVLELMEAALRAPDRFRLAVATSGTREKSTAVLRAVGVPLEGLVFVCGEDVTRKKPDPELFLEASARMELLVANCVVVEDAANGVEAARRAGMKSIAVTNTLPAEELAGADLVVDSLEEMSLDRIEKLFARA